MLNDDAEVPGAGRGSTTMTDGANRPLRALVPPSLSIGAAALWAILAAGNPSLTYHFAPLIVGLAWPIAHRSMLGRAEGRVGIVVAGGALAVALGTTLALWGADRMNGPTIVSDGGAIWEALLFSVIGAAWGHRALTRSRAGALIG